MKILLTIDGSDFAAGAARVLAEIPFVEPADVTVLTVTYDPETFSSGRVQPWFPDWKQHELKRVGELQQNFREEYAGRFNSLQFKHRTGSVAHEILDEAKELNADLIVLGAQGHTFLGRLFLGSVSDKVASHADCSVLVVRPPSEESGPFHRPRRLLLGYDGSGASDQAIRELAFVRWDADTELSVVTVAPYYDYLLGDGMSAAVLENEQEVFEELSASAEKAAQRLSGTVAGAHATTIRGHHVGDALINQAETNSSDLIVLGDTGHNLLEEWLIGSTTKYVLRHATCSIWISRHHRQATDPDRSDSQAWATT